MAVRNKKKTKGVGTTALGGAFELTGSDGKPVTEQILMGKWSLVYFGFTFCPDICPEELEKMTETIKALGRDQSQQEFRHTCLALRPPGTADLTPCIRFPRHQTRGRTSKR